MKLAQIYAQATRPVFSFEVFPPKTEIAYENLKQVLPQLVGLRPDFMTVTYGALGSTQERTLEIATSIHRQFQVETVCHLTCVGASRPQIDQVLDRIRQEGIHNLVALRGDPPQGQSSFVPVANGFAHANELVAHIRERERRLGLDPFGIGVAGYPEGHLESPDLATDLLHLKRKVDAGADMVVTQLFYDNRHFFRFEQAARAAGILVPIIPGLLPILSAKQILRITSLSRCEMPPDLLRELETAGDDPARAEAIGIRQTVQQAQELLGRGVPGIHFYVFNKATHLSRILQELRGSPQDQWHSQG
ncbi:MAG TPA: methylenetetrahydrofolate reductase [NAD(P)H] [Candidatus Paceibacterota bacterium]|nr:methylenetetrahydrofolate reductase [NAD(P)H] [Verrucomicrobiota bacterium]HRY51136.1 methylenetetrahydrofolate reductase [NAD(P)H] [Candidatus Paceibacterota bacterium]